MLFVLAENLKNIWMTLWIISRLWSFAKSWKCEMARVKEAGVAKNLRNYNVYNNTFCSLLPVHIYKINVYIHLCINKSMYHEKSAKNSNNGWKSWGEIKRQRNKQKQYDEGKHEIKAPVYISIEKKKIMVQWEMSTRRIERERGRECRRKRREKGSEK